METYEQADSGYPEEAPPEVVHDDTGSGGGDSAAERSAKPDKAADDAPDTDDGTATGGNP
jgi:hypothetical protein